MIVFVTSDTHRYTHEALAFEEGINVTVLSYGELKERAKALPIATYIFTDLDRVSPEVRRHASRSYRGLRQHGQRVLNDPARMPSRFGLLRALNRAGINDFDAYRVDALETPRRWPVFLRVEGGHGAPVSGLLNDADELEAAVKAAIDKGISQSALLIIEYAAEEVRPGLFRKLSVFRVGDRLLGYTCVHDDQWIVKYGKKASAPAELYEEEYDLVAKHGWTEAMRSVFDIANIEYGRVDFGLVGGRPQVYEINTNPDVKLIPKPSPIERRNESNALFRTNYLDALRAIDASADTLASVD